MYDTCIQINTSVTIKQLISITELKSVVVHDKKKVLHMLPPPALKYSTYLNGGE